MKLLLSPVFLICCLVFTVHQSLILFGNFYIPLVSDYLDPLVAMPIILTLLLWERRYLLRWKNYSRLSLTEVLAATLLVVVVAELLFPYLSTRFTADILDVLFFLIGALLFYFTVNPERERS